MVARVGRQPLFIDLDRAAGGFHLPESRFLLVAQNTTLLDCCQRLGGLQASDITFDTGDVKVMPVCAVCTQDAGFTWCQFRVAAR